MVDTRLSIDDGESSDRSVLAVMVLFVIHGDALALAIIIREDHHHGDDFNGGW